MACGAALGVFADGVERKAYRRVLANCTSALRSQWRSLSNRTVGLFLLALGADWAHSTAIERSAMRPGWSRCSSSVGGNGGIFSGVGWILGRWGVALDLSGPSDVAGVAQVGIPGPVAGRQSPLW